ncbi:MAG TPA: tyrosine--tRNA ligase [Acholeplasmataceae bacterium]|nr:tyrosine--tRNA ligase [Acholeplasmataceae bacterium]
MTLLEDLRWRGLIYDIVDEEGLEKRLQKGPISLYCGFDPTADSLHIGSLLPIVTLLRFKQYGNKIVALTGGGTGLIGDPSGKKSERGMNTVETVKEWAEMFRLQMDRFFHFNNKDTFFIDNSEWLCELKAIDMWRDYGKHFNINLMLQKDSVKSRLESGGLTYLEFSYMVMQSIDFLTLYDNKDMHCEMQIGGQDQWGNITAGMDLIRKVKGSEANTFALTMPLILKSDGTKYGKTESGAVWLDINKTSPYEMYQFFVNTADNDVIQLIKYYTFLTHEEINSLELKMKNDPHLREAQKVLASEVVKMVHGEKALNQALRVTEALFSGDVRELTKEDILMGFKGLKQIETSQELNIIDALIMLNLASSKREAREFLKNNAIMINGVFENDFEFLISKDNALEETYSILRRGKKKYAIIKHI